MYLCDCHLLCHPLDSPLAPIVIYRYNIFDFKLFKRKSKKSAVYSSLSRDNRIRSLNWKWLYELREDASVQFCGFFLLSFLWRGVVLKITHTCAQMVVGSLSSWAEKKTIWDCVCVKQSATGFPPSLPLIHTDAWHHVEANVGSKSRPCW